MISFLSTSDKIMYQDLFKYILQMEMQPGTTVAHREEKSLNQSSGILITCHIFL